MESLKAKSIKNILEQCEHDPAKLLEFIELLREERTKLIQNNLNAICFSEELPSQEDNEHLNAIKYIKELGLDVRFQNILNANGISKIDQLLNTTDVELLKMPGIGVKTLDEVKNKLRKMGISSDSKYPFDMK